MATMTYCAFENTANSMVVALGKMEDMYMEGVESLDELDGYEKGGLKRLVNDARRLVEMYDSLIEASGE